MAKPFVVPADPAWEPFDLTDLLAKDGWLRCLITGVDDATQGEGYFVKLEVQDEDLAGSKLSKNVGSKTKDVSWVWRQIIHSITGDKQAAKNGCNGDPDAVFKGHTCYVKTERYVQEKGDERTGVAKFGTKEEYEAARAAGGAHFRWEPRVRQQTTGLPSGAGGLAPLGGLGTTPLPPPQVLPQSGQLQTFQAPQVQQPAQVLQPAGFRPQTPQPPAPPAPSANAQPGSPFGALFSGQQPQK